MASFFSGPNVLPNIATGIAVIPTLFGINAMVNPRSMLTISNIPHPKTPEAQKLTDNLIRLFGSRDFITGALVFSIRAYGSRELLGQAMLLTALLPVADGFFGLSQTGGGLMMHWPIVPVIVGVGCALLGWIG
ncbi:hypothetical protein GQ53DRAFT_742013 [Thozetella sp. PMI_491]|nr:hypothetical protein GQ53DRAFT_742013 [Thozetella sp. PMI_491]